MARCNHIAASIAATVMCCVATTSAEPLPKQRDDTWVRPRLVGYASDAGKFAVDEKKVRAMFPNFDWTADQIAYIDDVLQRGDSRAAIVASIEPLVVSAYSDELDAVILVRFPEDLVKQYSLTVGEPLVTSWTYPKARKTPADIRQGQNNLGHHNNGAPLVADFFSSSLEQIIQRKLGVSVAEWDRVRALTPAALKRARDGIALVSHCKPASLPNSCKGRQPEIKTTVLHGIRVPNYRYVSLNSSGGRRMAIWFYSKTPHYVWLSNFSEHSIAIDGVQWPTVEHYYQAQKYPDASVVDAIRNSASPAEARIRGHDRSLTRRADWESVKVEVMRWAVTAKFAQHRDLREMLLATGDEELVHESGVDEFWGRNLNGVGENHLGAILMEVRAKLRDVAID